MNTLYEGDVDLEILNQPLKCSLSKTVLTLFVPTLISLAKFVNFLPLLLRSAAHEIEVHFPNYKTLC